MLKKLVVVMLSVFLATACGTGKHSGSDSATGQVVPGTQSDLEVNIGDRVYFDFDKSDLSAEARETLDRQASWLKQYPNVAVTVEGHCDERGTREYNMALGERRANSAKKYLETLGIEGARISTVSYGKERPVGEEALKNRRAVTTVNAQ